VVRNAICLLRNTQRYMCLKTQSQELAWLDRMEKALEAIPTSEGKFMADTMDAVDSEL